MMSAAYFQLGQQKTHMLIHIWKEVYRKQIGPNFNNCRLGVVCVHTVLVFQYFSMFEYVHNKKVGEIKKNETNM